MARANTANFEQLIVEVEFDPSGAPGTFSSVCGIIDATVNRSSNLDSAEVPDCDDESLPLSIEKQVRSQEVTVSGTGSWALQSHQNMMAWWRGGHTLVTRIRNSKVEADGAAGDTTIEYGPAILSQLNGGRTKGQKKSAEIQIEFDGLPSVTLKA